MIYKATKLKGYCTNLKKIMFLILQRYFVLSESATAFCILRIYYKNIESSWGTIPLKLKAEIPIASIISVAAVGSKINKGM
jgi:hypothetical protein